MRGARLTHVFLAPKPACESRKRQLCRIVCEGRGPGPQNVLVEFGDGHKLVTVRKQKKNGRWYSLRPAKDRERQQEMF